MERSPFWEANGSSTNQEIPRILWNPKVHYILNNPTPPVPILIESNTPHALQFYSLKIHFNIIPLSLVKFITTDISVNIICKWQVGATGKHAGGGNPKWNSYYKTYPARHCT